MLYTNYSSASSYTKSPVYRTLERFFSYYLLRRDAEKALACVSQNILSVGTGEGEVAVGKEQLAALFKDEMSSLPDPILFEMSDYRESQSYHDCWNCFCNMKLTVNVPKKVRVLYITRLTATIHKVDDCYLIDALHMSEASHNQEQNEFFPIQFVNDEMNKLNREAQKDLMQIVDQMMPGGIIGGYMEDGFPLYVVNEHLLRMAGYTYDEFLQDTQGLVLNSIHEDDREIVCKKVAQALSNFNQYEIEYRMKKRDGTFFWVHDIGRKTTTSEGKEAIISVLTDITEQVENRQYLWDASVRDSLTGVYNRKGYELQLAKALVPHNSFIFLMLDLDRFKLLNDIYGHHEGDFALQYIAKLLTNSFRKTDIICRLGGDEFSIFIANCQDISVIEQKVQQIIDRYAAMIVEKYPKSLSSVSFGGVYGQGVTTFDELYQSADKVLYEVKNNGRGAYKFRPL